jgi:hypothetical protein
MHAAPTAGPSSRKALVASWLLRLLAAAGLAVSAYVHADLAPSYDLVTATFSEGDLFRAEAGLSALAALLVLVWHRPVTAAFAFLVAGGSFALLLIYRYVNVGKLGPLPNMYEPIWTNDKKTAAVAQLVAVVASAVLLVLDGIRFMRARHRAREVA